jgi:hypothetical protein
MNERCLRDKKHVRSICRRTHLLLSLASALLACNGPLDCTADQKVAIRVHARDALTGAPVGHPIVTATVMGDPVRIILPLAEDSTVVRVFGIGGRYEVTVAKPGFISVHTQVDVKDAGSKQCFDPTPVDVTVSLPREP